MTRVDADGPAARAGVRTGWVLSRVSGRGGLTRWRRWPTADDHVRDFRALGARHRAAAWPDRECTDAGVPRRRGATTARQIMRTPEAGVPVKFGNLPTLFARLDAKQMDRDGAAIGVIASTSG